MRKKEEMKEDNPKRNESGCMDLTAYQAITNIDNEQKRFKQLIRTIVYICDLAGFEIQGKITLKNRRSGRLWK